MTIIFTIYKNKQKKPYFNTTHSEQDSNVKNSDKFTGAQIENIARKANINYVITGKDPDLASLRDLCANEHITKQQSRQKIWFLAGSRKSNKNSNNRM